MLTPQQLASCADPMIRLYSQLDREIACDIARRIVKMGYVTETAKWQAEMLQQSGMMYDDIIRQVSKMSDKSDKDIKNLFEFASVDAMQYDMSIYTAAGLDPLPLQMSPSAMQALEAGYRKTTGNLNNLTRTTATATQRNFINACTVAELQVTSGAMDYNTAIRRAVQRCAEGGAYVLYPSGHRDRLDVAVRRNIMTGLGQTTGEISRIYAEDMGCDIMEITAHSGARPSHASWQGQLVSLSGRRGYLSLSDIGYGTGAGFKGYNCRHDWYPYIDGVSERAYTDAMLQSLDAKKFEYKDKTYTEYEAEQMMRSMERGIRDSKRAVAAYDEAVKAADDGVLRRQLQSDFADASVKLKQREAQYRDFCSTTGLLPDKARAQVYGFGRSTAQKAVHQYKQELAKYTGYHYNQDGTLRVTDNWTRREHPRIPRQYKPYAVIETQAVHTDGYMQIDRTIYGADAWMERQIHSGHHNAPKEHPYGQHGEHGHTYKWDKDTGNRIDRETRELTPTERKEHKDIL